MAEAEDIHIAGRVRRVGNSLAFFIPAADARAAGLHEGDPVDVHIRRGLPQPLGLLKDLEHTPFDRRGEDLWRDRL